MLPHKFKTKPHKCTYIKHFKGVNNDLADVIKVNKQIIFTFII